MLLVPTPDPATGKDLVIPRNLLPVWELVSAFLPFYCGPSETKKSVWKKEKQENVFLLYVVLLRNVLFSLYLAGQVVELACSKSSFLGHTFILVLNHTKKGKEYDEEQ